LPDAKKSRPSGAWRSGKQIPLWTNPTVDARLGEKVRFHVLGTAFHTFHLQGHRWLEPGPTSVDTANLGTISRQLRR
jgi:hypothetical protein